MKEFPRIPLERQVVSIMAANRENSYATQRKRGDALRAAARSAHERFGLQKWDNLKAKHIQWIVERWKEADQGRRSIDEKLSHLRWLVRKIGKANLVPRSNEELGVAPGPRKTRAGKTISDERFSKIVGDVTDPRLRAALMLGRYLGLRFKEAMLFRPGRDWQRDRVWVKRGPKGGRPRYLFLHNARQREALLGARSLARGEEALIPREMPTYEKWRRCCYEALRKAGMGRKTNVLFHDLRRTYAVERMKGLLARGVRRDDAARLVARELGHSRTEILEWYIGSEEGEVEAA